MTRKIGYTLLILLFTTMVAAQDACPALVEEALDNADELCADLDRNEACYGNFQIDADLEAGEFSETGDITDVVNINRLELAGLDEDAGIWGVAMMTLQADIPDTLPGQNVTFLLFGDVEIETAVEDDDESLSPMQAFYLKTGVTGTGCEDAPDGLLVQTPDGVAEVSFNVNGADVTLGSTALLQTIAPDDAYAEEGATDLAVSVLEGQGSITAEGETQPIPAGSWVRLRMGLNRLAQRAPDEAKPYSDTTLLEKLPLERLKRRIELAPPLAQERLQELRAEFQTNGGWQQVFEGDVTVTVESTLLTPVTIQIGNAATLRVPSEGSNSITFPAGRYEVTICAESTPQRCFSYEHIFIRDQNHTITPFAFRRRGL